MRLKNFFDNLKWKKKTKTILKTHFVKEIDNRQNVVSDSRFQNPIKICTQFNKSVTFNGLVPKFES